MSNIAISVRHITKKYRLYNSPKDRLKEALNPLRKKYHKDFHAVSDVSFDVFKGETVGIIGRNGSGKSTLLKIITGVLTPSSGRAIVHGRISAILELGAGFSGEMTGLENIYLSNTINGIPENETSSRVEEIIEFAELGDFIYQPLKTYSSGMKARLAFAVAISIEPDILIVDEALSVGDAAFQRKCFSKMEQIRKNGATILFVSHSEASVVNLCSRAIWLVNGKKVLDGEPKLVTSLYLKNINRPVKKDEINKEYARLASSSVTIKNTLTTNHNHLDNNSSVHESGDTSKVNLSSFNRNLTSTSKVEYEENGARIFNAKVTDVEGQEVNILEHGKQYFYTYCVQVSKPLYKVRLAFLLKQKSGVAIGGGVYPSTLDVIEEINSDIVVRFKITCNLGQGEYFFNAGVQAWVNGKNDYAHRILDAYMVKVINQPPNMTSVVKLMEEADYEEYRPYE